MGAKPNWKAPLIEVQRRIRHFHAAGLRFQHVSVVSDTYDQHRIPDLAASLEPALDGWPLAHQIIVPTLGVKVHAHLFFGADWSRLQEFAAALGNLTGVIADIPRGLLPAFAFPKLKSQLDTNLLQWMCLVHAVAWQRDTIYLQPGIEFAACADDGIDSWEECRQPPDSDPLPWLIHQKADSGGAPRLKERFEEEGLKFPHILYACFQEETLFSSVSAVDVLAYVLPSEQATLAKDSPRLEGLTKRKLRSKVEDDLRKLIGVLKVYHDPKQEWSTNQTENIPMSREEIAIAVEWKDLARVTRRMQLLYPKGEDNESHGVIEYRRQFEKDCRAAYQRILELDRIYGYDAILKRLSNSRASD